MNDETAELVAISEQGSDTETLAGRLRKAAEWVQEIAQADRLVADLYAAADLAELEIVGVERARRPVMELAAKLIVKTAVQDDEAVLLVDCEAIMRSENDVRFWVLLSEGDGTWSHWPSDEMSHPLSKMLLSIASCYTDRMARKLAAACPAVGDETSRRHDALLWALTTQGMTLGEWTDEFVHHPDCDGECTDMLDRFADECLAMNDLRPALLNNDANHGPQLIAYLPDPDRLAEFARKMDRSSRAAAALIDGSDQ